MKNLNIIILARSGSKRIPGKNYKAKVGEKTLLETCLEKAISLIDLLGVETTKGRIILSTDCSTIAKIGAEMGVEAIISPHHTDSSTSISAVLYGAKKCQLEGIIILLQLTSPLVTLETLYRAIDTYDGTPIFAAKRDQSVFWAWDKDNPLFPQYQGVRSQDLPIAFVPCGGFYIAEIEQLRETKSFMKNAIPFEIPGWQALDIDTPKDLEVCKWHLQHCQGR